MLYYLESTIQENHISLELTMHGCKYCFFPAKTAEILIFDTRISDEMSPAKKALIKFIERVALKLNSAHYGPQASSRYDIIDTGCREDVFTILKEIDQFLSALNLPQEESTESLNSEEVLSSESDAESSGSWFDLESVTADQEEDALLLGKMEKWKKDVNALLPKRQLDSRTEVILLISGYYNTDRQTGPHRAGPYIE